jgi:hypothetical protein
MQQNKTYFMCETSKSEIFLDKTKIMKGKTARRKFRTKTFHAGVSEYFEFVFQHLN